MSTINENIRQLLDMLDNPEAYSEQEIRDIINRDEDTRETYRMMVEAKRSSRHHNDTQPINVDAAWQRFNQNLQPKRHRLGWMKVAASFIGVLIVSGIAFAAIHTIRHHRDAEAPNAKVTESVAPPVTTVSGDTLASDTLNMQPVIYENIPLEKMLPEISAHYNVKVTFLSEDVRSLRFRFAWNPQQPIDHVVSDLNKFEHLKVTLKDNHITVE